MGADQQGSDLGKAIDLLSSRRTHERVVAEEALEGLGPAAVEELMAILRTEAARLRRKRLWVAAGTAVWLMLMAAMAITQDSSNLTTLISLSGLSGLAAASQRQRNAAMALVRYNDVRSVGYLLEARDFGDGAIRAVAEQALASLLPKMQASDSRHLSTDQMALYNRVLRQKPGRVVSEPLHLAAVGAAEQIGDAASLQALEALAALPPSSAAARALAARAAEALPAARARVEQQQVGATLLRPAEAPQNPGAVLVRPVAAGGGADTKRLVRPADIHEGDAAEAARPNAGRAPQEERPVHQTAL